MYQGIGKYKVIEDFPARFNLITCGTMCKDSIISAYQEDNKFDNVCINEFGWISKFSPYWKHMEKVN